MEKIIEYLKQLELSELEAKLYLTLLQTGPVTVRELASNVDVKRTTAYLYIDQLVEKGLVVKIVKGAQKLIAANAAESLNILLDRKLAAAKAAESQFSEMVSQMKSNIANMKETEQAEIRFYKGKIGVKKMYEEALSGSEFRLYANINDLAELLIPNDLNLDFDLFTNALQKNQKLKIYEIIVDDPKKVESFKLSDTSATERYHFKFMPKHVGLTAPGILLYDNKVAIITAGEKLNSIVLHNAEYYENSVKLFDFIWGVLPDSK
jgi:sugar-specific transcriptional regulator TrmB